MFLFSGGIALRKNYNISNQISSLKVNLSILIDRESKLHCKVISVMFYFEVWIKCTFYLTSFHIFIMSLYNVRIKVDYQWTNLIVNVNYLPFPSVLYFSLW